MPIMEQRNVKERVEVLIKGAVTPSVHLFCIYCFNFENISEIVRKCFMCRGGIGKYEDEAWVK